MIDRVPTPLERRVAAVQVLVDDWRDRPFDWATSSHCARLVSDHLRRMGYTPPHRKAGPFKTALGAQRALTRLGVSTLAEAVDGMGLPAIAPAAALVGDIVELPGEGALGCLTVAVGNGRVIGFHEDAAGATILQPVTFCAAWRVEPK